MTSETLDPSTRQNLAHWASSQPNWIKAIAKTALECKVDLPEEELDRIFAQFLIENSLADGEVEAVDLAVETGAIESEGSTLRLDSLTHVSGVNALKPASEIEFNPKLTLIFGENAAGKSGYVRILKSLSSARCKEDILSHAGIESPPTKRATVRFTSGTSTNQVEWDFENPIDELTDLDVFDSRFAQIHVDDRLEYSYTPHELAVFPISNVAIDRIREKLVARIEATSTYQNNFQTGIPEGVTFRDLLGTVDASTDLQYLRSLAGLSEDEAADYERLKEKVVALQSSDRTAALKQTAQDLALLAEAEKGFSAVKNFDFEQWHERLATLHQRTQAYIDSGLKDFEAPTPGAQTEEWRQFIEAGEKLIQTLEGEYPVDGSECIYCGQELDEDAQQLLTRYRAYCTGELKNAVGEALREVEIAAEPLQGLDLASTISKLKARGEAEVDAAKSTWLNAGKLIEDAEAARAKICDKQNVPHDGCATLSDANLETLRNHQKELAHFAKALGGEASDRAEELNKAKVAASEYQARLDLEGVLEHIEKSIAAATWVKNAQTILGRFRGTLRSLTAAAKAASNEILNEGFVARFDEECRRLHAPAVKLSFPGGDARVERKKSISDRYSISQILSEGEQKAIALADFLAESRLRTSSSPIVFDDPVNSLDYKRIGYVAERLAELSSDRQIIVFTHNIWFASEILSHFDKRPVDCTYYDIEARGDEKGILSRGTSPRTDSFKKNKTTINQLIEDAGSLNGEAKQALVERGYEYLRNTCEIVVERELFSEVTRRYEPNIRMTKLESIKYDKLQEACTKTFEIFENCCRKIASHSQPTETLNVKPTLDDLKADWSALQEVRNRYMS